MITEKIVIPLLKAIITAVLVALFAASWGISSPGWKLFFMVLAGVALAAWVMMIVPRNQVVTPQKKQPVGLNTETTRIEIVARDPQAVYQRGMWLTLPMEQERITEAAKYYLKTGEFSHAMSGPGKPLTRNQYEMLRDELLRRELAYWVKPGYKNQGVALTLAGETMLKRFASMKGVHVHTRKNGREVIIDR